MSDGVPDTAFESRERAHRDGTSWSGLADPILQRLDSIGIWTVAVVLAVGYWWPLMTGHGLLGGDLYPYFFPLKAWYAERLGHGELALWNPLIGHGMPALGESQTAIFYPANLICYGLLPLNVAYNAVHIAHYVLAFGFSCAYLRRLGLSLGAALLGGIVWVYGWFPARSCLEWAIVTGAWLPVILWSIESYLATGQRRFLAALTAATALQLLAGHYNLAFITLLTAALYVPIRWLTICTRREESGAERAVPAQLRQLLMPGVAIGIALAIAAIQLLPSWELKGRSQRGEQSFRQHSLSYGNLPAWYLPQVIFPWMFYPDVRAGYLSERFGDSNTNQVEAHLYFGMLPILLAVAGLVSGRHRQVSMLWLALGSLALLMVTGWWTSTLGSLPGFGYFTGPGRYGVVVQMGAAVLAAVGFDALLGRLGGEPARTIVVVAAGAICLFDLRWAAQSVEFARAVPVPPISLRSQSPVAARLGATDRVLSKNQNSITLTGAAMLPVYLGIGPAEYYRPPTKLPDAFRWDAPISDDVLNWLRSAGVTHVLAFEEHRDWPVDLVWHGYDPMLHTMLGRDANEPLWLYRLRGPLGRAYWTLAASDDDVDADPAVPTPIPIASENVELSANRVEVRINAESAGMLTLTELDYPGWLVKIDGRRAASNTASAISRSVLVPAGDRVVTWEYRPASLVWGTGVSICGLAIFVVMWRWN